MLEFEQLRLRLEGNEAELRDLKDAIGYERLKREIDELELKAAAPGFWDDAENSQKILQKTGKLKNMVESYDRLCSSYDDLTVLIEMGTRRVIYPLWRKSPPLLRSSRAGLPLKDCKPS